MLPDSVVGALPDGVSEVFIVASEDLASVDLVSVRFVPVYV